jgi:hypothetical protein
MRDVIFRYAKLLGTDLRGARACHLYAATCTTGNTLVDVDTAVTLLHGMGVRRYRLWGRSPRFLAAKEAGTQTMGRVPTKAVFSSSRRSFPHRNHRWPCSRRSARGT